MKVVVAIDSLKGCLASAEAGEAAALGVRSRWPDAEVVCLPVSDGGEGWLEAFRHVLGNKAEVVETTVCDPLLRPVRARYLKAEDLAVIEVAEACGLHLLKPEERNPLLASSRGVGELLSDAVHRGCRHFIIGLGGSGVSDAGRGMIERVKSERMKSEKYKLQEPVESNSATRGNSYFSLFTPSLFTFSTPSLFTFTLATDVTNPLYGSEGAATVFGPQKGATAEMVVELDKRARAFAEENAQRMGFDRSQEAGAGAAGGLGYAFMQFFDAERRSGAELLLEMLHFDELIRDSDLIITGEGRADRQTLMGKLPAVILCHAQQTGIPCHLLAGEVQDEEALLAAGFASVRSINPPNLSLDEAMRPEVARQNLMQVVKQL